MNQPTQKNRVTIEEAADLRRKGHGLLALAASTDSAHEQASALSAASDLSLRLVCAGYRPLSGLNAARAQAMAKPAQRPSDPPTSTQATGTPQSQPKAPQAPPSEPQQPSTSTAPRTPRATPQGPVGGHAPDTTSPIPTTAPRTLRKWQTEAMTALRRALPQKVRREDEETERLVRPVIHAFMGAGKSIFLAEIARLACLKGAKVVVLTPKKNLVEQLGGTFQSFIPNTGLFMTGYKQSSAQCVITCYPSAETLQKIYQEEGTKVDILMVDEAHGSEGERVKNAILGFGARHIIGVTATPFRADDAESLTIFDSVVYRYTFRDGLRDNVVVPITSIYWSDVHGPGLPPEADRDDPVADDALIAMLRTQPPPGPCLTNATSIADATDYAKRLTDEGIPAEAIHSKLKADERAERIESLRTGRIKVLVHVSMLSEGADFPWLRALALRRQVASRTRFVQEVGRVLRTDPSNPEKTSGIVYDPTCLLHRLGLDHEDAIGEALDEAAKEVQERKEPDPDSSPLDKEQPRVVRLQEIDAWMLSIIEQLRANDAIPERSRKFLPLTIADLCANKHEDPSPAMWGALDKWTQSKSNIVSYIPCKQSREAIKAAVLCRELTRAQVGAMMTILGWLAEATQDHRNRCHREKAWNQLYQWLWPHELVKLPTPLTPPKQTKLSVG